MDMRAVKGNQKYDDVDHHTKSLVLSEVDVLKRVSTLPHCVALHGAYIEGFLSDVVMERCDMTLLQALESGPELTESTLLPIIKEMLQALDGIHKLGVVHRDIKPDNFLLVCSGRERTIKLCDFGFAVALPEDNGEVMGVFGTTPFMSPEMLRKDSYGAKTDVWSLGVLVYVLLCGQFPYHPLPLSVKAMKAAIVMGTPKPTFQPADSLGAAGSQPSPAAFVFLHSTLDRKAGRRSSAANALQLSWLASPADSQRSEQSLWLTLKAAKSVGAFELRAPRDLKQGKLDMMLASLQAQYHRDVQGAGRYMESSTCDSLQSTCAKTRESEHGSLLPSELSSWASHPSSHPVVAL
mmetsp:Transcript_7698/g.21358  ORF Transcript_7698/g.21358 Transcript_7698/m.21358 type:complete len:351 (-) Transcript_7698:359-1411(-)